jgi:CheY-like chemotaxis protein
MVNAGRPTRRRILVVDDDRDTIEVVADTLRFHGHEVATAHDGRAALAAVDAFEPEVVLLDLAMPIMDGFDLARRLRAERPRLVLVALSGYDDLETRRRAIEAGFDHHLIKPVRAAALRPILP